MYANGGGLGVDVRETLHEKVWRRDENDLPNRRNGKGFVRCICPKCSVHHSVYMLWTGRGIPRKYCSNCKPLIAGYDDAVLCEASIHTPGHPKKKGRRFDGE